MDEAIARERATQRLLTSEANYTRTALNETRFAEQLARDTTRSLAREISHVREDLNASRRSEDATRDALNRSRGEVEILLGETKRLNDQKTMLAEEALSRQRSLSNVAQDVHRQENIIRDKDDHIRHLEHQLANRQRECADLNSQVASLKRQVDEMNMNNGRLQSMSAELEER